MDVNQIIAEFLSKNNIEYTRYTHKPIFTVEDGGEIAEEIGIEPCKTLFLLNRQRQPFMLLIDGKKTIPLSEFARQTGSSRLSFASPDILFSYLRATAGAVSPLGLLFDNEHKIRLYIDKQVLERELIAMHPCVNTETYVFRCSEFLHYLASVNHSYYIL